MAISETSTVGNSVPDFIRDPAISIRLFQTRTKTYLFARYWCIRRIRGSVTIVRYINPLTYLVGYGVKLSTMKSGRLLSASRVFLGVVPRSAQFGNLRLCSAVSRAAGRSRGGPPTATLISWPLGRQSYCIAWCACLLNRLLSFVGPTDVQADLRSHSPSEAAILCDIFRTICV